MRQLISDYAGATIPTSGSRFLPRHNNQFGFLHEEQGAEQGVPLLSMG